METGGSLPASMVSWAGFAFTVEVSINFYNGIPGNFLAGLISSFRDNRYICTAKC